MINWIYLDDLHPPSACDYLVSAETDDKDVVLVMFYDTDEKAWIFDGEYTYENQFWIFPYAWAVIEPAPKKETQ